jgi:hypothetical protein
MSESEEGDAKPNWVDRCVERAIVDLHSPIVAIS